MRTVRVMVVDDHAFVRDALAAALEVAPDLVLAGACPNGAAAREAAGRLRPDVIVVDFALGDMSGPDLIADLRKSGSQGRFVLLTGAALDPAERASLARLVEAFVHKESGLDALLEAVRAAATAPRLRGADLSDARGALAGARLTERERLVVREIAAGCSVAETALRLKVSPATVRKHRENAMGKLGVNSTAALVRAAMQLGWA